jgi:hypothetical protein
MKGFFRKRAQDQKPKLSSAMFSKRAQEEMVGFALIVIIVAVIILVFLSFALRSDENSNESYEVNSFVQALLQHTTDCEDNLDYLRVQRLIFQCAEGKRCLDGRDSCEALNNTLESLLGQIWKIQERPEKGYSLTIIAREEVLIQLEEGEPTNSFGYGIQTFSWGGNSIDMNFKVYY